MICVKNSEIMNRSRKELRNSLIDRGLIMVIAFLVSILYACSADEKKQGAVQTPSTEEIVPEKATIKRIQRVDGAEIITIDQEGHDVDITIYWTGVGCSIAHSHDSRMCEKCRSEQGLPPN